MQGGAALHRFAVPLPFHSHLETPHVFAPRQSRQDKATCRNHINDTKAIQRSNCGFNSLQTASRSLQAVQCLCEQQCAQANDSPTRNLHSHQHDHVTPTELVSPIPAELSNNVVPLWATHFHRTGIEQQQHSNDLGAGFDRLMRCTSRSAFLLHCTQ